MKGSGFDVAYHYATDRLFQWDRGRGLMDLIRSNAEEVWNMHVIQDLR